jgi:hypothetical protein
MSKLDQYLLKFNRFLVWILLALLIVFVSNGELIGVGIIGSFMMSMFSAGMPLQADITHLKNYFKL